MGELANFKMPNTYWPYCIFPPTLETQSVFTPRTYQVTLIGAVQLSTVPSALIGVNSNYISRELSEKQPSSEHFN